MADEGSASRIAVVTGASRGLGLAVVRVLLAGDNHVIATARDLEAATELQAVADSAAPDVTLVPLDVTEPRSVGAAVAAVADRHEQVDLLINNAGVWDHAEANTVGPLADLDTDRLTAVLRTNAVGPVLVTQAFQALLTRAAGAAVVNLSSGLGSLERGAPRRNYGYAMSKAALNMATRQLASDLADAAIQVIALDPGWVKTDLGGPSAHLAPDEAAAAVVDVIDDLPPEVTGAFLNRRGEPVPW